MSCARAARLVSPTSHEKSERDCSYARLFLVASEMGSVPLTGGSGCASIQTTATWNQDLHNWGGGGLSVGKYRLLWYRLAGSD